MAEMTTYPRSPYEAILDVRYGQRFNELNETLYRRLDLFFGFVGLFGGTAAFAGGIGQLPLVTAVSGVAIGACAVIERLIRPIEKAVAHGEYRRRFGDLDARSSALTLELIDAELRRLQAEGPAGFRSLALPAYNLNLLSNGRGDAVVPETRWQRLVAMLA